MERAKKRYGSNSMDDRLSELPQVILHRILSFFLQKKAVRTSVLSKSWRNVWCTIPKIDFCETEFKVRKAEFLNIVNTTLQGYIDQKLIIDEFHLGISIADSDESVLFLENWIPILTHSMGVKEFSLSILSEGGRAAYDVRLPSVVFEAESLRNLHLQRCKLRKMDADEVRFKHLKALHLQHVYVKSKTFEKIISNCPLIETMLIRECEKLKTIELDKFHHKCVKHFTFANDKVYRKEECRILLHVPSVETVEIVGSKIGFHHHGQEYHNLKSLYLSRVGVSSNFDSCSFPSLQKLTLSGCYGFEEFKLFIDAPNIGYFEYTGDFTPSISFATTSREWKSSIFLSVIDFNHAPSWFRKLKKLLVALSQSEISLNITQLPWNLQIREKLDLVLDNGGNKPVVLEQLRLSGRKSYFPAFLNGLFCICRPRYIAQYWYSIAHSEWEMEQKELTELLCKILMERKSGNHGFRQLGHLEDVSMEISDRIGQEWKSFHGTALSECALPVPDNKSYHDIHFRLKWGEAM